MRSREKAGIDDVRRRFEAWRRTRRTRRIPDRLWSAATSLVGEYSSSKICRELRLNPSRFKLACVASAGPRRHRRVGIDRTAEDHPIFLQVLPSDAGKAARMRDPGSGLGRLRLTLESETAVMTVVTQDDRVVVDALCRALVGAIANGGSR